MLTVLRSNTLKGLNANWLGAGSRSQEAADPFSKIFPISSR